MKSYSKRGWWNKLFNTSYRSNIIMDLPKKVKELETKIKKIQRSNELKNHIIDGTDDLIAVVQFSYRLKFLYLNPSCENLLGIKINDLVGTSALKLIHLEDKKRLTPFLNKYLITKKKNSLRNNEFSAITERVEFRVRAKEGDWKSLIATINILDGDKICIVSKDTSKEKVLLSIEEENNSKFVTIFNESPDVIFFIDESGSIIEVNDRLKDVFGYDPKEVIGQNIYNNVTWVKSKASNILDKIKESILEKKDITGYESEIKNKNGRVHQVEIFINVISKGQSNSSTIVLIRDITGKNSARDDLKEYENRISEILSKTFDGIAIMSGRSKSFVFTNDSFKNMLGYSEQELIDKKIDIIHPSVFVDYLNQLFEKVILGETLTTEDIIAYRKDKKLIYVKITIGLIKYKSELSIITFYRNITDSKVKTEEIAKRNSELIFLNHIISEINTTTSLDDLLRVVKKGIMRYLQFDAGWVFMLQKNSRDAKLILYEGVPTEYAEMIKFINIDRQPYRDMFEKKEPVYWEEDNSDTPALIRMSGVKSFVFIPIRSNNELIGSICAGKQYKYQFLNDDKRVLTIIGKELGNSIRKFIAEEDLRTSETKFRAIIEHTSDIIAIIDTKSRIKYISPSINSILGYSKEDIVNRSILDYIHKDESEEFNKQYMELLSKNLNKISFSDIRFKRSDSEFIWVEGVMNNLEDKPEINGVVVTFRDISEKKRIEEEEKSLQVKLLAQSKLATLGEVSTGVAHEINQPLTYISTYLQLISKNINSENMDRDKMLDKLIIAKQQVKRIDQIIKHMRIFGRNDDIEFQKVSIAVILENTLLLIGERIRLNSINLILNIENDLPDIFANVTQMEQVFINLFQNSIDALKDKENNACIRVVIYYLQKNNKIVIELSDNGVGISNEEAERIFEPFYTTKPVGKGTGLGLSIVYGIINDHSGSINYNASNSGETCFVIQLPALLQIRSQSNEGRKNE